MLDLETLFKNHFSGQLISDDKLRKFAEIQLERLKANNGTGEFAQLIADTTTAYQLYAAAITDESVKFAQQQGLTVMVYKLLKDFKNFVATKEGIIRAQFGKKGDAYQAFFPLGKNEYWQSNFKNVEMLMDRLISSADHYSAELGTDLKNDLQTMLNDFKNAREAQLRKKGEVANSKTTVSKRRKELEIQLLKNLHFIGFTYPGNVNRCNDFFDQSFLRRKKKAMEH